MKTYEGKKVVFKKRFILHFQHVHEAGEDKFRMRCMKSKLITKMRNISSQYFLFNGQARWKHAFEKSKYRKSWLNGQVLE